MVIKLKNINIIKIIVIVCTIISGAFLIFTSIWLMSNEYNEKNYFDSVEFEKDLLNLGDDLLKFQMLTELMESEVATDEEINMYYEEKNRINIEKYKNYKYIILDSDTKKIINTNSDKTSKVIIDKIIKMNNYIFLGKTRMTLNYGKTKDTYNYNDYPKDIPNVIKYIKKYFVNIENRNIIYKMYYVDNNILRMLKSSNSEIYLGITNELKNDVFLHSRETYNYVQKNYKSIKLIFLTSSLIFMPFIIIFTINCGIDKNKVLTRFYAMDKLFVEVQLLIFLILYLMVGELIYSSIYYPGPWYYTDFYTYSYFEFIISYLILSTTMLLIYGTFIKRLKNKSVFKYTIFSKVISLYKSIKVYKRVPVITVGIVIIYGYICINNPHPEVFLVMTAIILVIIYLYYKAFNSIFIAIDELESGNFDFKTNLKRMPYGFKKYHIQINNIQTGMRNVVEKAIKTERMKTELITNVSHDLKTPLTSIITYVDLLKKENLESKKANEYLNVLETKSESLKKLIYDLLEISKVSSGNIEVNLEKISFEELIIQSLGEYEKDLKNSKLQIKLNIVNVDIIADGRRLWRSISNILENVIKYSVENSRVYISLFETENYGVLTIKNISKEELEITPEELRERFVRGSESRTTEGSGLGLSIAGGLIELQGGLFEIEIDGDLFKIIIKMKKYKSKIS